MPRTITHVEEEDPMPLTDLLRTGEASRLRRRGAMRGAHRREDSDELPMPLARRVRVDASGQQGAPERREGDVHLELSCGVRTVQLTSTRSSPSRPSPLPQIQSRSSQPTSGFIFASTGCGATVNSSASPRQPGCSVTHQVYMSTDLSNPDVTRLSSRYLDSDQRSIAEFLSNDDCGCRCEWEAIGCSICGNPLGFLYVPCHPRHSLDTSRAYPTPSYIFFPSSVTPSPAYTFPPIDPSIYRSLPPLVAPSESDDMSIASPTFSPRVQMSSGSEVANMRSPYRIPPQDDADLVAFNWFTDPNPMFGPRSPTSPTIPLRAESEPEASGEHRLVGPRRVRREEPPLAAGAGPPREALSDDDWSFFLLSDRPAFHSRRHTESRDTLHPWVPREQRERVPGSLMPGERAVDRLATLSYPRSPDVAPRDPDPERPPLHRGTPASPGPPAHVDLSARWQNRYTLPPTWSTRLLTAPPPWSPYAPEHTRDARTSRWASPSTRLSRRTSAPAPSTAPAFTLVDSIGERSYPPSARSSLDVRDTLSVGSDVPTYRAFGRRLNEDAFDEEHAAYSGGVGWNSILRPEDPEADDEEKADDERRAGDSSDRRGPSTSGDRAADEEAGSDLSQLPSR